MSEGWIKLHRKILDWEWWGNKNTFSLFVYLLLNANHKDKRWQGHLVKRGQVIVGRKKLAKKLKMSQQNVRTALKHLKSTNEVTIEATRQFSLVTINNWEDYQGVTNEVTNDQPTTNQRLTTTKNVKNEKNVKNNTGGEPFKGTGDVKTKGYLLNIPKVDIQRLVKKYQITERRVVRKGEELYDYVQSKGKTYKNYFAFLQGAIRREYGYRTVYKVPDFKDAPVNKEGLEKLASVKEKLLEAKK